MRRLVPTIFVAALGACAFDLSEYTAGNGTAGDAGAGPETSTPADATAPPDGAVDAGADSGAAFADDFNRPNASTVGNGWIMKHVPAFALVNGQIVRQANDSTDYTDDIVYRPQAEDVADVEASVEVQLNGSPAGWPQMYVRVQSNTVGAASALDAYLFFLRGSFTTATLARQHGSAYFTTLKDIPVTVSSTDHLRFRLSAKGTNPVVLTATLERLDAQGNATSIGTTTFQDSDPARIATPGSVGFSAGRPETAGLYAYDNFVRTPL